MDEQNLIAAFDRSFPIDFQIEMLKQLDTAYKESFAIAKAEYGAGFWKNARPQLRVQNFNKKFVDLAQRFNLKAEACLTVARNCRYALVEGREMLLLVKLGEKPSKLPYLTVYIRQHTENNPDAVERQLSIEGIKEDIKEDITPTPNPSVISLEEYRESKKYSKGVNKPCGILVHGYSDKPFLNFAQILVPNSEYSGHLAVVDLFARYPAIFTPQEEIIEISEPIIRRKETGESDS